MSHFGQRLKSARIMAKFSMDDLVEKIDGMISKQSISKYEKGIMKPENSKIVIKLAHALNVPVDFFYKENEISLSDISFRKNKSLGKKEIESIKERIKDHLERYFELETLLNLNNPFNNCLKDETIFFNPESIEGAAKKLKQCWKLGEKESITSVVELLEKNNIKIIELELPSGFEGLSGNLTDKPFIVLNKNVASDRKRFTALHELAHIILNIKENDPKKQEKVCHAFAGAFLISKMALEEELGRRNRISLQELVNIKKQYGISIQAIMAREYFLGFISEYNYTQFIIYMGKNGMRKKEPGEYSSKEESTRFSQLLNRAVAEGIISMSKAAVLARKSLSDIEKEIKIVD